MHDSKESSLKPSNLNSNLVKKFLFHQLIINIEPLLTSKID